MPKEKMGKTGNAEIVRQGHTSNSNFGDLETPKSYGQKQPKDVNANAKGGK